MVEKRLYRSERDRIIAGVCGGLAEYLDIDPTVIRFLWVVITVFAGSGILIYILACFLIPSENYFAASKNDTVKDNDEVVNDNSNKVKIEKDLVEVKIE